MSDEIIGKQQRGFHMPLMPHACGLALKKRYIFDKNASGLTAYCASSFRRVRFN